MADEKVYTAANLTLYLQETTSNQLDSISGSADTTQTSKGVGLEFHYSNQVQRYIECDGVVKYFEGPVDITGKIEQLFAYGELFAALVGQDSESAGTHTVTKYTAFLPRLTIHAQLDGPGSQDVHIRLQNVVVSAGTMTIKQKQIVLHDVEFVGESLGTTTFYEVI